MAVVKRHDWCARPPDQTRYLKLPVKNVFLHRTDTEPCFNLTNGLLSMKRIQNQHMDNESMKDIRFNFVIAEDGIIYEGCGWRIGAHTAGFDDVSVGIAIMGNSFMCRLPKQKALDAVKFLIDHGVGAGKIDPDYRLYAHKDTMSSGSECPGEALIRHIRTWDKYDDKKPMRESIESV
ncbi:peptidoglycan-recognition protein LF-like [Lineus longissimus]|uniref:peptidoglycan-recognition protein LF-like n=1 Tax=Lineus longissimus TaxID=88925 RepID=UPI002B4E4497